MEPDTRSLSELDMKPDTRPVFGFDMKHDEELDTWPHMESVSEFDLKFRFKLLS